MSIVALASTIASIFISTNYSLCCIALLSLCLSTKQQYNSSLNNFQYYLIKLSSLILLKISLQLNNGSSHLMVLIPTTNTIDIINATCCIIIIKCITTLISTYDSLHCVKFSSLRLSSKQQNNFFLNNLQYFFTKSPFSVNKLLPKLIPKNKTQPAFYQNN